MWELPLSADGMVMELENGLHVRVRPIRSSDAEELQHTYDELSPESRYYRFFTARPRMPLPMAKRLTNIDHAHHFAWVVFDVDIEGDHHDDHAVAAARMILDEDPTSAECAITVIDQYHHRGIGRFLIELLVCTAADLDIEVLRFDVLRDNHKMRQLMGGTGASAAGVPGDPGIVEFKLAVPPADTLEVAAGNLYRLLRHIADEEADTESSPDDAASDQG